MADLFTKTENGAAQLFRNFCNHANVRSAAQFQGPLNQWDPHILLLLNGLLHIGEDLEHHVDRRLDEFLQQIAHHFVPGEVIARPAVHLIEFSTTDPTRFVPGIWPRLGGHSALFDARRKVLGYFGAPSCGEEFCILSELEVGPLELREEAGRLFLRFELSTTHSLDGALPPLLFFLQDGPGKAHYQFLDMLWGMWLKTPRRRIQLRPSPQKFSFDWTGTPWYREHYRYLDPYPGALDMFFEVRGLTGADFCANEGKWTASLRFSLPRESSVPSTDFLSQIKVMANVLPLFAYTHSQRMVLSERNSQNLLCRSADLIWLRALGGGRELFQPSSLYLGELWSDPMGKVWHWTPPEESPLTQPHLDKTKTTHEAWSPVAVEVRGSEKRVGIEALIVKDLEDIRKAGDLNNYHIYWEFPPEVADDRIEGLQGAYSAGFSLREVGRKAILPVEPRRRANEIRDGVWNWISRNFRLSANPHQLESFLNDYLSQPSMQEATPEYSQWESSFRDYLKHLGVQGQEFQAQTRFGHSYDKGIMPTYTIDFSMPPELASGQLGDPLRGRLVSMMARYLPFFQERLPPHLKALVCLHHQPAGETRRSKHMRVWTLGEDEL